MGGLMSGNHFAYQGELRGSDSVRQYGGNFDVN